MCERIDLRDYVNKVFHSCEIEGYFRIYEYLLRSNDPIPKPPFLPEKAKYLGFKILFIPRDITNDSIKDLSFNPEELEGITSLTDLLMQRGIYLVDTRTKEEKDIGLVPPFWV